MNISVILVRPRNPQNIGAAARAMGNFGLSDLRVVDPYEPTWREAVSAVGAYEILHNAKLYSSLKEALFDADLILATTALKNRKINQAIASLPDIRTYLEESDAENCAIIFGPEKTGLSAEDISLAHCVLNIPTTAKVPSINLAQAVILCCYELSKTESSARKAKFKKPSFKEVEIVQNNVEKMSALLDLPPVLGEKVRARRLAELASKRMLDKEDLFFINSIVNKIISKLEE
ncbi:MAG: RNA methyltransferase [Elusimicrobia bacterium]|nr:RNA methyltransferase [Elusimicrobiota bacterium]